MGADLYIREVRSIREKYRPMLYEAAEKRNKASKEGRQAEAVLYQAQVDFAYNKLNGAGYFRDSYNSTNLLWRFDLSYWKDFDKFMLNEEDEDAHTAVSVEGAKWLLSELKSREARFYASLEKDDFKDWSNSRDEIIEYFQMKYLKMRVFLKMAIKFNSPIDWST